MKNSDRVHPRKPEGIEKRKAHIIGGGIAGLSATTFFGKRRSDDRQKYYHL